MVPISYNLRSLMVRRTTTLVSAFGVALVVFVFAGSLMLSQGIQRTLVAAGRSDNAIVLRKGADTELTSNFEARNVALIAAAPGVKATDSGTPMVSGELVSVVTQDKLGSDGQVSNVQVRGVSEAAFTVRPEVRIIQGRALKPGTDEVVIGKSLAGRFRGMQLNASFELKKNRSVTVVGIFEAGGACLESEIWADIETVRAAYGRDGLVSSVTVRLTSPSQFETFRTAMESDRQLGLDPILEPKYYEKQSEGTRYLVIGLGVAISVLFSLGAMIGAMITMYGTVAHRQREIGTLRALGFNRLSILTSFLIESSLLAILGGIVGIAAASCMSFFKISMMNLATWQEIAFSFEPSLTVMGIALGFGALMGIFGGFFPALRAAQVSPIQALRDA